MQSDADTGPCIATAGSTDGSTKAASGTFATPPLQTAVQEAKECLEHVRRLQTELSRDKPSGSKHTVWKYYQVYVSGRHENIAIYRLYRTEGIQVGKAEARRRTPHEPSKHLGINYPEHQEVYEDVVNKIEQQSRGGVAGSASASELTLMASFTKHGGHTGGTE